jgi:general stress protein YciG
MCYSSTRKQQISSFANGLTLYDKLFVHKQRYGLNFYEQIGRKGGKISRGGGFAMNRDLAVEAGRKGGKASRRTKSGSAAE